MKDFLKFTLATVTGIILSSIVLFIIGMVTLFGIVSTADTETIVKKNSVMMLDLNGVLVERTQESPLGILSQLFSDDSNTYGLDDILSSIKKAKENENIKGIYLQASMLGTSYASLQEIRNALLDFKESGKFIIAYGDSYTQGLYYLSSVADKVLLNPKGMIEWKGIASAPLFYKDLLQKIGVEMQIFKVGTYKSAVEPFISTEMSPANREQVTAFINSIWGQVTEGVSASRSLPVDSLNALADRMLMFYPAEESVQCGLADTLIYRNDVRNYLKQWVDLKEDDRLPVLGLRFLMKYVFKNPLIWILGFANFFVYIVRFSVLDWGPSLLSQSKGVSMSHAGWLVAMFEIAGILGMLFAGWATDKWLKGRAHRTCVFCMAGAALFVFLLWQLPADAPIWLLFTTLCAAGFCIYGPQALIGIAAANQATKKAAATANGLTGLFGYASTLVSGVGLGFVAQHYGWNWAYVGILGMAVVGMLVFLLMWGAKADGYEPEAE